MAVKSLSKNKNESEELEMKKKKYFLSAGIGLVMAVSLAGCTGGQGGESEAQTALETATFGENAEGTENMKMMRKVIMTSQMMLKYQASMKHQLKLIYLPYRTSRMSRQMTAVRLMREVNT